MLYLKGITKVYEVASGDVHALKGIDIGFRKNEFVSILGPSGCGKTTTLNIIGGLDKYTSGDLIIAGKSTKNFTEKDWDIYRNHRIKRVEAARMINSNSQGRGKIRELLISNY